MVQASDEPDAAAERSRTGAGFVANVEPGWVTVSAVRADTNDVVAQHTIWAEADVGSILVLWPDPT